MSHSTWLGQFFFGGREGEREDVQHTLSVNYCVVCSTCDILVLPVLLLLQSGKLGNMGHVNLLAVLKV